MSMYRGTSSYVPWSKSSLSTNYSGTSTKGESAASKYDGTYSRSRPEAKKEDSSGDKASTRLGSTYRTYGTGYQRDTSTGRDASKYSSYSTSARKEKEAEKPTATSSSVSSRDKLSSTGSYGSRSELSGRKAALDKKEDHPPVTYRTLTRTGCRTRDPSPLEKEKTELNTTSSSYNYNRLYPKTYTRSVSRERTESVTSPTSTSVPKYSGRSSTSKDDLLSPTKYGSSVGRISRQNSKEDLSTPNRYKATPSRTSSREDLTLTSALSTPSSKYIQSRFLPKNSVEKSYSAYPRTTTSRLSSNLSDSSRKNRELLNSLSIHNQRDDEKTSRPPSRCSSVVDDGVTKDKGDDTKKKEKKEEEEMITVTVVTRSTSPTPPNANQTSYLRSRRPEMARVLTKDITRPKKRRESSDKEIQSDRLDDTARYSRFGPNSVKAATPWSNYLDLKYSSPGTGSKYSRVGYSYTGKDSPNTSSQSETSEKSKDSSSTDTESKVQSKTSSESKLSRNNSTKSLTTSSSKSDLKSKETKLKTPSSSTNDASLKSKSTTGSASTTTSSNKKLLPPQIPKLENTTKSNSITSITTNKDFRKSVLNMNPEGKSHNKSPKRSGSVSSESETSSASTIEIHPSEATDVSENLSTCMSYNKTKSSSSIKQPEVSKQQQLDRERRSNTRSPSVTSECSSTSTTSSSEDDALKIKKSASSGLKLKKPLSGGSSRTSMIISADELTSERCPKPPPSPRPKTEPHVKTEAEAKSFLMRALAPVTSLFKIRHQDSSHNVNWMESSSENIPDKIKQNLKPPTPEAKVKLVHHAQSGERAWWMDENSETAEGVRKSEAEDDPSTPKDGKVYYKIRKDESRDKGWWLDSPDVSSKSKSEPSAAESEYIQNHRLRHIDSGERAWWQNSSENLTDASKSTSDKVQIKIDRQEDEEEKPKYKIWHQNSGPSEWWLASNKDIQKELSKRHESDDDSSSSDEDVEPLGDRASPEGLETPREEERGRLSPYDNVPSTQLDASKRSGKNISALFISRHTNIDDILGTSTQPLSPLMDRIFGYQNVADGNKKLDDECGEEVDAGQVRIHDSTAQRPVLQRNRIDVLGGFPKTASAGATRLDDAALQLYKDGDYGSYLDLEASISEQQEEFDGFQTNKKNSIVLRTQLSVRVHTIIEKLLKSEGRELRRALFSLKQIFQEDKDLVHEFVQNDGLACLIKVGSEADQNYQNYILRALGQVMLYVDGMNGVMEHNQTVQWLYTLISSKFRLVVKTALKLLLVFVEYIDSNCMLLIKAVSAVDSTQGLLPWYNIMKLLKDFDSADTELLIYATTLINKCLNGIPDQDTYYDQADSLEEQGIEAIIQRYMSKPGTDLDLLQQFQIYEAVLHHEDGDDKGTPIRHLDESIRKTLRSRKSMVDSAERRKSRRHSTGTAPMHTNGNTTLKKTNLIQQSPLVDDEDESSSSQSSQGLNDGHLNGSYKENNKANDAGVTPALRRRRERAERQRSFIREQQESVALLRGSVSPTEENENGNGNFTNALQQRLANGNMQIIRNSSRKDLTPLMNAVNKLDSEEGNNGLNKQPWILSMMYNKSVEDNEQENEDDSENTNENDRKMLLQLKRENTVKDLTQKLANQNIIHSPSDEGKINRIGDMTGLISKAKEGLAKSKSKADVIKSPTAENIPKVMEVKKTENELRWEELIHNMTRPLNLCDMDFTDLASDDETDILTPTTITNGIPPPPPPLNPPPPPSRIPPPVPNPPVFGINLQRISKTTNDSLKNNTTPKKSKKTVKLFWKEVRDDPMMLMKLQEKNTVMIWDELSPVAVDTQKLEHLFESRAKDLITKKQQEMNKNKEIIVLDPKRSNAINIGMTKLPPPRSIKTAILKMDATIMNREGIEKLLTMLPTEEERTKIQDAQASNPDLPLGSAEQFLLTLASISELPARLKLWAFKLDFENSEREIAEPLMDLKQGIEVLRVNKTFRGILSTLLSIGIFLNGNEVKGFQIEYLAKVPEVKDTVHKHSLLHHLCHIVMEKFPDATDLYSEIGAITRASKIDFDELSLNIQRLETDCKSSWDHLKLIAKHDGSTMMKIKMSDFLSDCAERIILLEIVHRRVMNRYHKFLLWLGIPLHQISDSKPNEFCRIVSEFSLEYRTTRERVLQQLEKKANHRERNKTRGKMITEIGKFKTKEDRADAELRQLLGNDLSDVESLQGTLSWRRQRRDVNRSLLPNKNFTDGDDEIIESLVKTVTKNPSSRTAPRERKRTRHADRKSLKRSRTRENNPFGSRDSP